MKSVQDTIVDFLQGTAIGDSFGAGIEFQDRNWIQQHVNFKSHLLARDDGYRMHDYTDDTEMTVAIMKELMGTKDFTPDRLVEAFGEEYDLSTRMNGYERVGHGAIKWIWNGEKTVDEVRRFQSERPNPGCAPTIRAAPLGFLDSTAIDEYAAVNAVSTHPHSKAIDASRAIAHAAHFLLVENNDPVDVINYVKNKVSHDQEDYFARLDSLPGVLIEDNFQALAGPQPFTTPMNTRIDGVPSDALKVAGGILHTVKHSKDAFDALKRSVRLGGDVDSIASVAVGLVGGVKGLDSIPSKIRDPVESIEGYLFNVASTFSRYLLVTAPHE